MEIAERLGDEVLWTGGAEAYAWHMLVGGGLAEGIDTLGRAFDVAIGCSDRSSHGWP